MLSKVTVHMNSKLPMELGFTKLLFQLSGRTMIRIKKEACDASVTKAPHMVVSVKECKPLLLRPG